MLAKQFDVFLCNTASLVDSLSSFASAGFELFSLALDFLVESFQDWEDLAFEVFVKFDVHVGCSLALSIPMSRRRALKKYTYPCVVAHHLEQSCNTFQALVEVMTFSQRVVDGLEIVSNESYTPA